MPDNKDAQTLEAELRAATPKEQEMPDNKDTQNPQAGEPAVTAKEQAMLGNKDTQTPQAGPRTATSKEQAMYRNVLLFIDLQLQTSWENALPAAIRQADGGGTLHLLGIVPDNGSSMALTYLPKDYESKALQEMKEALDDFATRHGPEGTTIRTHVGHGHIAETILKVASNVTADLIMLVSPRHDELRSILISSYTNAVVQHSPCSVMVIR